MILKIAYNDFCQEFVKDIDNALKDYDIQIETYHEQSFKERKKAFKLKGMYGTKLSPIAELSNNDGVLKVFYSDDNKCNVSEILNTINDYLTHERDAREEKETI